MEKYNKRAKKINSLLCVGLDSDFAKIPKRFLKKKFPQFEFNKFIITETHQYASAFKMNSAFYEACGGQGMIELKMTMDYLRTNYPDIFIICDAKRADRRDDILGTGHRDARRGFASCAESRIK